MFYAVTTEIDFTRLQAARIFEFEEYLKKYLLFKSYAFNLQNAVPSSTVDKIRHGCKLSDVDHLL